MPAMLIPPRAHLDLLFACMQKEAAGRISGPLEENIEWPQLLELARRHQLTPLLYWALKEAGVLDRVPESIASGLDGAYHLCLARNIGLRQRYDELSSLLAQKGIPHCPLRGIDWAFSLYPSPGLRSMSDVDLLVSPVCREETRAVLRENGYRHLPQEEFFPHHDIVTKNGTVFEIHFHLANGFVRAAFPEFDDQDDLAALRPFLGRPYCALHYWVKIEHPAVWISDFLRLPAMEGFALSPGARILVGKTAKIITQAEQGNYDPLFFSFRRPNSFWLSLLLRVAFSNPARIPALVPAFLQWQKDRVGFRQWLRKSK